MIRAFKFFKTLILSHELVFYCILIFKEEDSVCALFFSIKKQVLLSGARVKLNSKFLKIQLIIALQSQI